MTKVGLNAPVHQTHIIKQVFCKSVFYIPSRSSFEPLPCLFEFLTPATRTLISQQDGYYAFGMEITRSVMSPKNEYLYNKKELQEELGQLDYGARFYDPVIGRFTTVDPNVEDGQESTSPYGYVFNNPVKLTDPDGRAPTDIIIIGANNSSVTVQTSLVNASFNISSTGIDLRGNHTINGEKAVQVGLDLASLVDPSGVTSALSASISAKNGEWVDAGMSALGAIPLFGKLADAAKVEKDLTLIGKLASDGERLAKAEARAAKLSAVGREGEDVTKAGKDAVHELTAAKNDGKVICQSCKVETTPATQSRKGITPSGTERQADHIIPKSEGGSGTPNNGQSLCRDCNIKKSNN